MTITSLLRVWAELPTIPPVEGMAVTVSDGHGWIDTAMPCAFRYQGREIWRPMAWILVNRDGNAPIWLHSDSVRLADAKVRSTRPPCGSELRPDLAWRGL